STGPGLLTRAYHDYLKKRPNLEVNLLYPDLTSSGLQGVGGSRCSCGSYAGVTSCRVGKFGAHLHAGSWRNSAAVTHPVAERRVEMVMRAFRPSTAKSYVRAILSKHPVAERWASIAKRFFTGWRS